MSRSSKIFSSPQHKPPARRVPGGGIPRNVSARRFAILTAITVLGLFVAIAVNRLFAQVANVKIAPYQVGKTLSLDINGLYILVLTGIILLYLGIAAFSFFA